MSFIDFLLKYYIWILGVLIVLILIVIGVLVESKSKEKGEKKERNKKSTPTLAEAQNPENITTTSSEMSKYSLRILPKYHRKCLR